MSEKKKPRILLYFGPPVAVASFLAAFWASGMAFAPDPGPAHDLELPPGVTPTTEEAAELARAGVDAPEATRGPAASRARANRSRTPVPEVKIEPGKAYPAILVEESEHEFGKVIEGDEVAHTFVVSNSGDAPLEITKVRTSCGCTVADYTETPIDPGTTGTIDVVFKTKAKRGKQNKRVYVHSNDPRSPRLDLYLKGTVEPVFFVEPRDRIDLRRIEADDTIEPHELIVKWRKDFEVEVTEIVSSSDAITVEREPYEDEAHRGVALTVEFGKPSELLARDGGSRINQSIQVHTNHERFRRQHIFINGTVLREVMATPRALAFGQTTPERDVKRTIRVTTSKSFELEPPAVRCPVEYVTVEVVEKQPGRVYDVVATLLADKAPKGEYLREYVEIRTNSEDVPEMRILMTGRVGPPRNAPGRNPSR